MSIPNATGDLEKFNDKTNEFEAVSHTESK